MFPSKSTSVLLGLLLSSVCWFGFVRGFGSGAPRQACRTLNPSHYPNRPQTRECPFNLTIAGGLKTYSPGEALEVTITGGDFKGFMFQARQASGNEGVGRWQTHADFATTTRTQCDRDSAMTHTSRDIKSIVKATWIAPDPAVGDIYLVATVAKSYSLFWSNIRSNVLVERQPTTAPPPTTTVAAMDPGANATTLCQDSQLQPLSTERPYVGILCGRDLDCPCGWICCPQCQDEDRCDGHAICRRTIYEDAMRMKQNEEVQKAQDKVKPEKSEEPKKDDSDGDDNNIV